MYSNTYSEYFKTHLYEYKLKVLLKRLVMTDSFNTDRNNNIILVIIK